MKRYLGILFCLIPLLGYSQFNFFRSHGSGAFALATLTTTSATAVGQTTATTGGNVSSDGGSAVTQVGVCYAKSEFPTLTGTHTHDGGGIGTFVSSLTGLDANSTYYVRAYATNGVGTAYGNQVSFTTTSGGSLATVLTVTVDNITETTADMDGNVTADGGSSVTDRGVCWGTSFDPVISGSHAHSGTGTGTFTAYLTGLSACVWYYVRAFATNSTGTSYGNLLFFQTTQPSSATNIYDVILSYRITGVTYYPTTTCTKASNACLSFNSWDGNSHNWTELSTVHSTLTVGDKAYQGSCSVFSNGWYMGKVYGISWIQSNWNEACIIID